MLRRIAPSILLHHDDLVLIPVEIKKTFQAETFPEWKTWSDKGMEKHSLISHSSPTADIQLYTSVWFLNFSPSFTHALLSAHLLATHSVHSLEYVFPSSPHNSISSRVHASVWYFSQFACEKTSPNTGFI